MKPKTLNQRAAVAIRRLFGLPRELYADDADHIRIGWFHSGYRAGWLAAQRKARKSK